MVTIRFTEDELTARARKLADEQGPGWAAVMAGERVGKDTAELRYWRELARQDLRRRTSHRWRWRLIRLRQSGSNRPLKLGSLAFGSCVVTCRALVTRTVNGPVPTRPELPLSRSR